MYAGEGDSAIIIDTNTNKVVGNPITVGPPTSSQAYDPSHARIYVSYLGNGRFPYIAAHRYKC